MLCSCSSYTKVEGQGRVKPRAEIMTESYSKGYVPKGNYNNTAPRTASNPFGKPF